MVGESSGFGKSDYSSARLLQLCEALEQIGQDRDTSAQWQVSVVGQDALSALVSFMFLSQFFLISSVSDIFPVNLYPLHFVSCWGSFLTVLEQQG